jgi:hypothetical protein
MASNFAHTTYLLIHRLSHKVSRRTTATDTHSGVTATPVPPVRYGR